MKKPTIHKKLTLKEILKRHRANPQDKELHKTIENEGENDLQKMFNNVVQVQNKNHLIKTSSFACNLI